MSPAGSTAIPIRLSTPERIDFSRFGRWIRPPAVAGERADYSAVLEVPDPAAVARLHVNCIEPGRLPYLVTRLERHPLAWQTFLPLDVARYTVVVAGTTPGGAPDLDDLHAVLVDGSIGIAYAPGVWHAGATVLERRGHFAVIWPRDGARDEIFVELAHPLSIDI